MEHRGRIREVRSDAAGLGGDRVPPHDLDAERAVVGAMLVSETAVAAVADVLTAEDFYSETHRIVYGAAMRLYAKGEPIDQISLSNELGRGEEFDRIGGRAYVFQLVESVPTAANAARYAEIVRGKALLRAVIDAGSRIAEDAFREPDDVGEALDAAEQLIYGISNRSLKEQLSPVSELAPNALEMIQHLYESEGDVTGVETGFEDLDRLTTGFHKSDLVILAARPAMGKTALALNAIWHASGVKNLPVAIFSLEMSKEQLVQRLISQTTRIATQDLRSGNVRAEDWPKLVRGVAEVSRAPVWIDDTAGISMMEMRAKVRRLASRLQAQGGPPLSLVVVDYLQLMIGNNRENRQQEVAEISRSLKVLARDLDVPVLAIAQLSRAVEQRHDKRPLLSDLRDSGCLPGDTLVTLADGSRKPIGELCGKKGFEVAALDTETYRLTRGTVTNAFCTGVKPVFRLTTRLGKTLRLTANHPLLTVDGWRRADEVPAGERIAVPRHLPGGDEATMSDAELALLAHLIGDGCTLARHAVQYTTRERDLAELVTDLADTVFGNLVRARIHAERTWYQVYLASTRRHTHGTRSAVAEWLDALGAWNLRSYEKRVPDAVFSQPAGSVALFLKHLWATDGTLCLRRAGRGRAAVAMYATSSDRLAHDVQSLLLRLDVRARVKRVDHRRGRPGYHVIVTGQEDFLRFAQRVGAIEGRRTGTLGRCVEHAGGRKANTNRDIVPQSVWRSEVVPAMQAAGVTSREMQAAIGQTYCGTSLYTRNLSRERAARVAAAVNSALLAQLAESDVYWDEVVSIEPDGEEAVYDLTVEGPHSFVADDIIVHNSIEQDADMVMFLYRDEYYNPDSDDKGIAEVLVGKHRNGPTGKIQLAWLEQYTKFGSLARR